jgi:hypothetical protein
MGLIYADVVLLNPYDSEKERLNVITKEDVRRMEIKMLVDTGAVMLAINEEIQAYFNFKVLETQTVEMANGQFFDCEIVGPVDLRFKNRGTIRRALVLPGNTEPVLGSLPLGDLDVLIDPLRQRLIINPLHPEKAHLKLRGIRVLPLPADTTGPAIL